MTWTTQRPQVEGWYWWRNPVRPEGEIYHINKWMLDNRVKGMGGEWSSTPIERPGENKEDV